MGEVIKLRSHGTPEEALRHRIDKVRAEWRRVGYEWTELERQFCEDDIEVRTGRRRGQPLTHQGRYRRMRRLLESYRSCVRLQDLESELGRRLDRFRR